MIFKSQGMERIEAITTGDVSLEDLYVEYDGEAKSGMTRAQLADDAEYAELSPYEDDDEGRSAYSAIKRWPYLHHVCASRLRLRASLVCLKRLVCRLLDVCPTGRLLGV